jgi:two-component system, chemotaxis family, response regulator Rcp1
MNQVPHNILLIEDNPGDVWLIEESLRAQGIRYNMRRCETVDEALQVVASYRADDPDVPGLILLDYNLPGGESLAVIEAAVKNPALAGARKAVITSSVSPRDRRNALQTGAECFIYKPADLDSFLTNIGQAIQSLLSGARPGNTASDEDVAQEFV